MPEVVTNFSGLLPGRPGDLVVLNGDGSGVKWRKQNDAAYGAAVALGDLDNDGRAEIVVPIVTRPGLLGLTGDYALQAYNADGDLLWESEEFTSDDFDYATGVVLSDMDHDGSPGDRRRAGHPAGRRHHARRGAASGRGSVRRPPIAGAFASEAAVPAVADLDLDGTEEVIVGDTRYDPDGNVIWRDDRTRGRHDRARQPRRRRLRRDRGGARTTRCARSTTTARVMWGPLELPGANIVSAADHRRPRQRRLARRSSSPAATSSIALHADGSEMWSVPVQDESGATGASRCSTSRATGWRSSTSTRSR
jgi:hypothetical protein